MQDTTNTSVIILAAGFSSRMKQAKFALKFDEKITFLEKIVQEYDVFGCKEIIAVMNSEGIALKNKLNLCFPENVKFILNKYPERERFYSLQTGLKAMKDSSYVFIQNIDNPFVDQDILTLLYEHRKKADYIAPTFKAKGGHPILISNIISKKIIKEVSYNINLKEYLNKFAKFKFQINNNKILLNINNKQDYLKIIMNGNS
ncbi:MAG: NTP transferase domain-containing protein [Bacteroidales bacterium]|nr:NTP transferase domain-containing protein [Bacteroidales bacterium]